MGLLDNHPLTQSLTTRSLGKSWLWHSCPHVCWVWRCTILGWRYLCFLHQIWESDSEQSISTSPTHTPPPWYTVHIFFFFFLIYLVFTVLGLCCSKTFSLWWSGATLQLWCVDFSLQWFFLMQSTGSRCRGSVAVAHSLNSCNPQAVEHRLNSCRTWALFFCYLWDLPRPAIEPMSPASVGWLFATEPPGKAQSTSFNKIFKMAPTTAGRFYHWG